MRITEEMPVSEKNYVLTENDVHNDDIFSSARGFMLPHVSPRHSSESGYIRE
jgi:hypothetical protein